METLVIFYGAKMHATRPLRVILWKINTYLGYYQDSSMDANHRIERWCSKPKEGNRIWKNSEAILNNIKNKRNKFWHWQLLKL